jgi:hypothetical protein
MARVMALLAGCARNLYWVVQPTNAWNICNFHQHKLCIDPDRPHGIDIQESRHKPHHLMLVEELDNGGKKEVVCSVCREPTFGPAYKCSTPKCAFFHQSGGEPSHVIHHPLHPQHALFLQKPSTGNEFCAFCLKDCGGSFFYGCSLCSFNLDVVCGSR